MLAPFAVLCVELFPPHVRYAASGIGDSIGAGLFGGISPLVATALVSWTGQAIAPAYYVAASLLVRETLGTEESSEAPESTKNADAPLATT